LLQFDRQGVPHPRPCSSKAPVTVSIVCTLVNQMTGDGAVWSERQAAIYYSLENATI